MTSITQDDAYAIRDYERFTILLRETRNVWTKIRCINQELNESHDRIARLEKEGLSILERIQQRDCCAPRAKQMAREAAIAGWSDLDNAEMRNDPAFKELVPETSFLFRGSAYMESIQKPEPNNNVRNDSTFASTSSTPFPPTGQPSRLPFPPLPNQNRGSSSPAQSGESIRQRALSVVTVFGRRIHRLISSPMAPRATPSEAAQEREDLKRVRQVQDHIWLTRRHQGGRMATQAGPILNKYTVSWPTSDDPVDFVPLLETAFGLHLPGCPFQRYCDIIHSDDRKRGHHRSPSSHCDACQAGILVERKITEFLRLTPQGGGHLLSVYDQWKGTWYESQVHFEDREFVERGMKFVQRCIHYILQEDYIIDPKNNVSPVPPAPDHRNARYRRQRTSRI